MITSYSISNKNIQLYFKQSGIILLLVLYIQSSKHDISVLWPLIKKLNSCVPLVGIFVISF